MIVQKWKLIEPETVSISHYTKRGGGNDLRWGADTIGPHQYTDKTTTSSLLPRSKKQSLKTTDQKRKGLSERPNISQVILNKLTLEIRLPKKHNDDNGLEHFFGKRNVLLLSYSNPIYTPFSYKLQEQHSPDDSDVITARTSLPQFTSVFLISLVWHQ
ncbi:Protein CBG06708 [Caenorhabditis briggsae]|uniref:Protein CBG06708 n=1 Tax=Caenorhabditis briggsae TaxID=6238 RepID=A8X2X1_CAEBR|nr:Protein CBG06708 [Caenorhabditis briggsae]CAP26981.1 Protein CBG06708 [Caenorhabditis briggsae]